MYIYIYIYIYICTGREEESSCSPLTHTAAPTTTTQPTHSRLPIPTPTDIHRANTYTLTRDGKIRFFFDVGLPRFRVSPTSTYHETEMVSYATMCISLRRHHTHSTRHLKSYFTTKHHFPHTTPYKTRARSTYSTNTWCDDVRDTERGSNQIKSQIPHKATRGLIEHRTRPLQTHTHTQTYTREDTAISCARPPRPPAPSLRVKHKSFSREHSLTWKCSDS